MGRRSKLLKPYLNYVLQAENKEKGKKWRMVSSLLIGRLYTLAVSLLIALIAYPSQIFLFIPAFDNVSIALKVLIPFNLLVFMVYWNYYLAVQTDPGRVPGEWVSNKKTTRLCI